MSRIFTVHQLDFDGDTENSTNDIIEACRKAELDEELLTFKMMTPAAYFADCLRNKRDLELARAYWRDRTACVINAYREYSSLVNIELDEPAGEEWSLVLGYVQAMKFEDVVAIYLELRLLSENKVGFGPDISVEDLLESYQGDGHLLKLTSQQLDNTQSQLEFYFIEYQSALAKVKRLEELSRKSHNRAEDLKRQKNALRQQLKAVEAAQKNQAAGAAAVKSGSMSGRFARFLRMLARRAFGRKKTTSKSEPEGLNIIEASPLFSEAFYLNTYPDVKSSPLSPAQHYLRFGGFEGRNPSERFDSEAYLNANTDVKEQGINPLLHFERFGRSESRPLTPKVK